MQFEQNFLEGVTAISASSVWAVGFTEVEGSPPAQGLIEHWNGTQWTVVPNPALPSSIGLIGVAALSPDNAWAVGFNGAAALFEHWNGTTWKVVAGPPQKGAADELSAIAMVPGRNRVWAVGLYVTLKGVDHTLTAFHC